MSQPTKQRPPQVSLASGIVMFSSLMVLLTAWERVTSLRSLETQEAIRDVLADAPFSSLGLTVPATTELLRISCMVAAACACATAILGWYVRRPDRSARLSLTLFAIPVFVTGIPAGGLAGSFVAAGAAMLWMQPAREWFATGRWTPPEPVKAKERGGDDARRDASSPSPWGGAGDTAPPEAGDGPPSSSPGSSPGSSPDVPPPASRPFGEPAPAPAPVQQPVGAPAQSPYGQPYPPQPHAPQPSAPQPHPAYAHPTQRGPMPHAARPGQRHQPSPARPGALVAAFVITVVTAGGLLSLSLLWLAIAGLSPDFLRSVLEQQQPEVLDEQMTMDQVRSSMLALAGVLVVWSSASLVLAGFAMARRAWARRGLIVSASFSAGACLALVLATPLVLVPAAAAVATVVCLRRVEVRRWFSPGAR
ncbi:hypothetical protein [Nocardioides sp. zg-1228]|uniref:hypothetical protein n=1 Tax=Nocardioides sp. zg-1228 TaxID=2763008 RepID=UPI001642403C|nr:hypothetical protein [Nocardioides sp. zg-1228]MBC2931752.1 hypothetical protein [Nocardioides sp. zg-1228]QSF57335.1 hypothetical protein JX575_17570 [Nocardioides sp. zg-1228]